MSKRDDPLDGLFGATPSATSATVQPKPRRKPAKQRPAPVSPVAAVPDPADTAPARAATTEASSDQGSWTWTSGIDVPKTHRYPLELMDRLDDRTKALDLPVGLTVAAALATFLDLTDEDLVAAVERAQTARKPRLRRR